jgi:PAS domain S-box-containing protein
VILGRDKNILVIDDDQAVRESLAAFLEDREFHVITAANGRLGLDVVAREAVDVVIVDLRMPEVDGLEVLTRVRRDRPRLPVIVVSGTGDIADVVEALRLGAWDYVLKPIEDMSVLTYAIQRSLERADLLRVNLAYQESLELEVEARTEKLRISNTRLHTLNERLRRIVDSTRNLSGCTSVEQYGSMLLEEFGRHMTASGGSLFLVEDDRLSLVHSLDPGHAPSVIPLPLPSESVLSQALVGGRVIRVEDIRETSDLNPSGWGKYGDGSLLVIPLTDEHGQVLALISLHSRRGPSFSEEDEEIGHILASYASETLRAARAAGALADSEKMHRLLTENQRDLVMSLSLDARVLYCSPSIADFGGYDPDEETGVPIRKFFARQDEYARALRSINKMISDGRPAFMEFEFAARDGTLLPVEASARPLVEDGEITAIQCVLRDLTFRKQAVREKAELEEQLRHSQRLEAVGHLAGAVAHDFNNLLSPILGYSEILLLDIAEGDSRHGKVDQIHSAAVRARNLTRQLLAFGRKQTLEMTTLDLNDAVTGFEKMLRRTIRENVEVTIRLTQSIGSVCGDVGQIEQILLNLAINAQDAMIEGGQLTIETAEAKLTEDEVRADPGAEPGRFVVLRVSDTGCGMDEATIEHIFEPFYTTKGTGTGLGLSSAYGIAKQHCGCVRVHSAPGRGSTFEVLLPRCEDIPEKRARSSTEGQGPRGTERIFVVEDEEMVRDLTVMALNRHGYEVIAAETGEGCLRQIAEYDNAIDLLLTDVVMPGMNGKELYDEVTSILPDVKVIYMSGYSDVVIEEHGIHKAKADFLQKPFSIFDLTSMVRKALDA